MAIEAILFDCDGVLVDSEVVGLEDSVAYLQSHGFPWTTDDVIRRFTGMRTDRFAEGLREGFIAAKGRPPTDDEFAAFLDGLIETRRAKRHEMRAIDGANAMLDAALRVFPGRLAVASSSAQIYLDDKIRRYDFGAYFDEHVYSADQVAHGKPAPDIFLHAADRLGIAPANCLVIEDSPNGVEAGVAAGMVVWGFTGGGHCLEDHAERLLSAKASAIHAHHPALARAIAELGG